MKHFAGKEIADFLKALDGHLRTPTRIEMIGGAVALVCFKGSRGTVDIDITGSIASIVDACRAARASTGLDIPVRTAVWDAPYEYESRLKRLKRPALKKLHVFVPEKHDWVWMKLTRYNEKDARDIQEIASKIRLNATVLITRFMDEMTHVMGNSSELVLSFLVMIERLFGNVEASRLETKLRSDKRWREHCPN